MLVVYRVFAGSPDTVTSTEQHAALGEAETSRLSTSYRVLKFSYKRICYKRICMI